MGMKHQEESIALQAIEFWSTVCETETDLAWEAAEVRFYHGFWAPPLLNSTLGP